MTTITTEEEDDDDFFGDQSSTSAADSNDGDRNASSSAAPYGNVPDHEYRSRELSVQTLSFLDGYDETKETKLQLGFSDGYTQSFHDAFRIGQYFGSLCAQAARDEVLGEGRIGSGGKSDLCDSARETVVKDNMKDSAILVKKFLHEEVLLGSKDDGADAKYKEALLQLEQQLIQLVGSQRTKSHLH